MRDLLARHVKGDFLREDELLQLDQWLQANGFTRESLTDHSLQELALYTQKAALFNPGKKRLPKVIRMHVFRMQFIRITAAAVVLALLSLVAYWGINRNPSTPSQPVTQHQPTDISPATSQAILTLADHSTIQLGATGQDTVVYQDGSVIRRTQDGLVYAPAGTNEAPDPQKSIGFNTLTTPEGGFYRVTLPDGSGVWLNAASSLKFPPSFSADERLVELTGEGFFDIQRKYIAGTKTRIPFRVKTAQGIIEVTGTRFNVNVYNDADNQVTTLVEGAVTIRSNSHQIPACQLLPGQKALSVPGKAIVISPANIAAATGWMKGWFTFEKAGIKEAMQQIARWYGVEIKYGPGMPGGPVIDGSVERTIPLSNLLTQLEATIGENLQFRMEGKVVFVSVRK
ncbi:FecR family protein [Paraflavitalea soli]|nr:FecR family protein [Paraflavitalea soli]